MDSQSSVSSIRSTGKKGKKADKKWFKDVQVELSIEESLDQSGADDEDNFDEPIEDEELITEDYGTESLATDMMIMDAHGSSLPPAERFHGTGSSSLFSVDEFSTTDGNKGSEDDFVRDSSPPPGHAARGSGSQSAGKPGSRSVSPQAKAIRPFSAPTLPPPGYFYVPSERAPKKDRPNAYKPAQPKKESWFKLDLKDKKFQKESFDSFLERQQNFLKTKRRKDERELSMKTSDRLLSRGLISQEAKQSVVKLLSPRKIGPEHEEFLMRQKACSDARLKRIRAGPQLPASFSTVKPRRITDGSWQEFLERQQGVTDFSINRCKVPMPQPSRKISAKKFEGFLARQQQNMERTRQGIETTIKEMW
eukprot:CAMPEP_0184313862 /NCGR_PEP_ID=MMETSP1049-20130417/68520_1 /TAXON_ID=77928 /ORGANISM="Proteomonas sulcata, Strain CCMP704" /LENGTH=363 /DNA_ID=CAMNT_0026631439 /DNA_START=86 /DNA_END=1174 /DNA_ORIENTATION=+